jgi:hypothetical protein
MENREREKERNSKERKKGIKKGRKGVRKQYINKKKGRQTDLEKRGNNLFDSD